MRKCEIVNNSSSFIYCCYILLGNKSDMNLSEKKNTIIYVSENCVKAFLYLYFTNCGVSFYKQLLVIKIPRVKQDQYTLERSYHLTISKYIQLSQCQPHSKETTLVCNFKLHVCAVRTYCTISCHISKFCLKMQV